MDKSQIGGALGCISILPATIIGLVGLTDGIGPTGWRGFAELFGWIVVCATLSYGASLCFRPSGWSKASRRVIGVGAVAAFTWITLWLGLDAPMRAKVAFTSALQIFGILGAVGSVVGVAYGKRAGRYSR